MILNALKKQIKMLRSLIFSKIPSITGLVTTAVLNSVQNNMLNVVMITSYDIKILHVKIKYLTTSDYNKFTNDILNAKIKEKELVDRPNISGFVDLITLMQIKRKKHQQQKSI